MPYNTKASAHCDGGAILADAALHYGRGERAHGQASGRRGCQRQGVANLQSTAHLRPYCFSNYTYANADNIYWRSFYLRALNFI